MLSKDRCPPLSAREVVQWGIEQKKNDYRPTGELENMKALIRAQGKIIANLVEILAMNGTLKPAEFSEVLGLYHSIGLGGETPEPTIEYLGMGLPIDFK